MQGFLGDSARVLVTHQVQLVGGADRVLALHKGSPVAYGTPAELHTRGVDLAAVADAAEDEEGRSRQSSHASAPRGRAGTAVRTKRLGSRGSDASRQPSGEQGEGEGEEQEEHEDVELLKPGDGEAGVEEDEVVVEEEEDVEEVLKDRFASIEELEDAVGGSADASACLHARAVGPLRGMTPPLRARSHP